MKPITIVLIVAVFLISACSTASTPIPLSTDARPVITAPPTPTAAPTMTPLPTMAAPTAIIPTAHTDQVTFAVLAQVGGALTDFVTSDSLAYLAVGPRLIVVETTPGKQLEVVFTSVPLTGIARQLVLDGDRLYWLAGDGGVLVFDLSDPRQPDFLGSKSAYSDTKRMVAAGDLGVFAAWDCVHNPPVGKESGTCQAQLNTSSLSELQSLGGGGLSVPAPVEALHITGQTLFLVHPSGVMSVDLSDPASPEQLAEFHSEPISTHAFSDGIAYLFSDRLSVLDLRDPSDLKLLAETEIDPRYFNFTSAAVDGERLYGFSSMGEFGFCTSNLVAFNIANPVEPAEIVVDNDSLDGLNCASQAAAGDGNLLAVDWNGLNLIDLDGPPRLLDTFSTTAAIENLAVQDGSVYWGNGLVDRSLHVVDLRNPASPASFGPFPPQWISDLVAAPGQLFASAWQDGAAVLSLTDPLSPVPLAQIASAELDGGVYGVALDENVLFLNLLGEGVQAVDVTEAAAPVLQGRYRPFCEAGGSEAIDITAAPGRLYLLRSDCRDAANPPVLEVINTSDLQDLTWLSQVNLPVAAERFKLAASGDLALVAAYPWEESPASGELFVIDNSSVYNPQIIGRLVVPGDMLDVLIAGNTAYLAAGEGGVWAVDLTDPAKPYLAGHLDTPGRATALGIEEGRLYVADGAGGVGLYAIED